MFLDRSLMGHDRLGNFISTKKKYTNKQECTVCEKQDFFKLLFHFIVIYLKKIPIRIKIV